MFSRCLDRICIAALLALASHCASAAESRVLRVCADPDNLPYSHEDRSGFENRIAELLAAELKASLAYTWMPQWRGFVRKTFGEGTCDVWMGVPEDLERLVTTRPYYRSSYVFVFPDEPGSALTSFDDPRLNSLRVGVQLVGNDLAATPPGHALAARGAIENVSGFTVFGEHPAAQRMIDALSAGRLDAALIWGPQAGYYARRSGHKFALARVVPPVELKALPFEFSISMGVKRGNKALLDELNAFIEHRQDRIDAILDEYGVPRLAIPARVH